MNNEFDRYADTYDDVLNKGLKISGQESDFFAEAKIKIMAEKIHASNPSPKRFLDFGCGTGNIYEYAVKYLPSADYYGIDVSEESVKTASKNLGCSGFNVFDGARICFQDETFDAVCASVVFHHIPFERHADILEEIYRVLKFKGSFFLFEHNAYNPVVKKVVKDCPLDENAVLLTPGYARDLFASSKFTTHRLNFYMFFPRLLKWFRCLEPYLSNVPLGAQYYVQACKK